MTSERKAAANKKNALKSTGPQTEEGKARSGTNAIKHGILSKQVLLAAERPEDLESLSGAILADLRPVGAIEITLADEAISCLWRLRRAHKAEASIIDQHRRVIDAPAAANTPEFVHELLNADRDPIAVATRLRETVECLTSQAEDLAAGFDAVADLDSEDDEFVTDLAEAFHEFAQRELPGARGESSACAIREHALADGWTPKTLNSWLMDHFRERAEGYSEELAEAEALAEPERRRRTEARSLRGDAAAILPSFQSDPILRYERAIKGDFYRALRELERRQAARLGRPQPQTAALEVTVSGNGDGGFVS